TQSKTTVPPTIIPNNPAKAVVRFHSNDNIIKGPNADPKPAQAFPTKFKILSFGFKDNKRAIAATISTEALLIRSILRVVVYWGKKFLKISSVIELEVTNN